MKPITSTDESGTFIGKIPMNPSTIATKKSVGIVDITIKFAEHLAVLGVVDIIYFLVV